MLDASCKSRTLFLKGRSATRHEDGKVVRKTNGGDYALQNPCLSSSLGLAVRSCFFTANAPAFQCFPQKAPKSKSTKVTLIFPGLGHQESLREGDPN